MAKTVMIVEDNELNMKLFHDLLEAHGYTTVATRNGIEALDLARLVQEGRGDGAHGGSLCREQFGDLGAGTEEQ